jgi:predicted amidohydrolase
MAGDRRIKVALGQMDIHLGDVQTNRRTMEHMVTQAAAGGAQLIVLPELWSTGYDLADAERHAVPSTMGIFAEVAALARQQGIAIAGSLLSRLENGKVGNTAVYFEQDGRSLGHYSKIHLFRLMAEDQYLGAGDRLAFVEAGGTRFGLAICYDLRFPEMFRRYALGGAEAVILPSEWPHPRLNHWIALLQARAIENQMFLLACNRVGTSEGTHFFGHSCIVDPWGEFVVQADEQEGVWFGEIDLTQVADVRKKIPVFEDRRPELYR